MLGKFLYVGVGGSGTKTLRHVRQALQEQLDAVGWTEGFPRAWQLVSVDLPPDQEDMIGATARLAQSGYIGVAPLSVPYKTYDEGLSGNRAQYPQQAEFAEWRLDPATISQQPWIGAGQQRAIGRTVILERLGPVVEKLQELISILNDTETVAQFDRLQEAFGHRPDTSQNVPFSAIVGSMAGGTGSGTLLDVADALRLLGGTTPSAGFLTTLSGFIFTPDVFEGLPRTHRTGVEANSLGMASELMSAFYDTTADLPHHAAAGLAGTLDSRRGPRYPFFLGRANNVFDYGSDVATYGAAGQMLAAFATDSGFRDSFTATTQGNWTQSSNTQDLQPVRPANEQKPVSSIGFARLGLGSDRFAAYARQRLARAVISHLVEAPRRLVLEQERDPEVVAAMSVEHAADRLVDAVFVDEFASACHLEERTEERNQVLDQLLDLGWLQNVVTGHVATITTRLNAGTRKETGRTWLASYLQLLDQADDAVRKDIRQHVELRAREAADHLVENLVATVEQRLGTHGIDVSALLVDKLVEIVDVGIAELRGELTTRDNNSKMAVRELAGGVLKSVLDKDVAWATNAKFRSAVEGGAQKRYQAMAGVVVREYAISLMVSMRDEVLVRLASSLHQASEDLKLFSATAEFRSWPQGGVVPDRFEPTDNEVLLEEPAGYPDRFTKALRDTTGAGDPLPAAVRAVLRRDELPAEAARLLPPIDVEGWAPVFSPGQAGNGARVEVKLGAKHIQERNQAWMGRDPGAGIGRQLNLSIQEWVDDPAVSAAERGRRHRRLVTGLNQAIGLAQPLAQVDTRALLSLHNIAVGNNQLPPAQLSLTPLPIGGGTALRDDLEEVLLAAGVSQGAISRHFDGDLGSSEITLSTQSSALHPSVFTSYRKQIVSQWLESGGRPEVWGTGARARRFVESIPLPKASIRRLVRSWYICTLTDALEFTDRFEPSIDVFDGEHQVRGAMVIEVRVCDSDGRRHPLPSHGPHGWAMHETDVLPMILDAYAITDLLAVSGNGSLDGYGALLQMGTPARLKGWLAESSEIMEGEQSHADMAREALQARVDAIRQSRAQPLGEAWVRRPLAWCLEPVVDDVLTELIREISETSSPGRKHGFRGL